MKVTISKLASLLVAACLAFTLFAPPAMAQDGYPIVLPFEGIVADLDPADSDDTAADAAAAADEVLGVSVTAASGAELAFTGSNVDTTALIGAALIGSGALATLASRKRRLRDA